MSDEYCSLYFIVRRFLRVLLYRFFACSEIVSVNISKKGEILMKRKRNKVNGFVV